VFSPIYSAQLLMLSIFSGAENALFDAKLKIIVANKQSRH
jgi:hypothetical protein